jgi:hypothetical protein
MTERRSTAAVIDIETIEATAVGCWRSLIATSAASTAATSRHLWGFAYGTDLDDEDTLDLVLGDDGPDQIAMQLRPGLARQIAAELTDALAHLAALREAYEAKLGLR